MKNAFLVSLLLMAVSPTYAGFLDKISKGNRIYVEWNQVYVDRGDIKVMIKKRVYSVPSLHTTGTKLYVSKRRCRYLCKAKFENYYPLPTPNGVRKKLTQSS